MTPWCLIGLLKYKISGLAPAWYLESTHHRCTIEYGTIIASDFTMLRSALLYTVLLFAVSVYAEGSTGVEQVNAFLDDYCERCHNDERLSGGWSLSQVATGDISRGENLAAWEMIFRMTREGAMPPPHRRKQPTDAERAEFAQWLQGSLDNYSKVHPNPGRATLRRLNRAEYANAVRDILVLDVDVTESLPTDDSGYGFDNIADVLSVSATLMDRYLAVAGRVSRLAVGLGPAEPVLTSHRVPKDGSILNQGIPAYNERMSEHLPLDSRGGDAFAYFAPHDGVYEISGYLNANTNNEVDRLEENRYKLRVPLAAGAHYIGMSFRKQLALEESVQTLRNNTDIVPLPTAPPRTLTLDFVIDGARVGSTQVPSYHMSPRYAQHNFPRDVLQIDVEGPFQASGPGDTPSRRHIFSCQPGKSAAAETRCARRILARLARQAYRRPATREDVQALLTVYAVARQDVGFEGAIATALQAMLVSPSFLFVDEAGPADRAPGQDYRLDDFEFATRLALFLWSSIPDDELLALAERRRLRQPKVLQQQLKRMLADPKARALTENFAGQWLYLRNLDYHRADVMAFPDFDVRLRRSMREESERFFATIVRDNRSLLDFISADRSYLNERLAQHYGVDGVKGTQLRPVSFSPSHHRGGLLGQASLLTLTSYGNHTSVVKRGQWILDALLAAPPPPPPPDVPALVAEQGGKALNAREQLMLHREDPACASCHVKMDPLGLALENYDAIGAYRTYDAGRPIDASAVMPDGTEFEALAGLRGVLMARKDQFTRAFVEQLMTYALGRGLEAFDRPVVRAIASEAAAEEYRIHQVILGIVESYPFNYRRTPQT